MRATLPTPETRTPPAVERFKRTFARLDPAVPMPLDELYHPDVRFEDPLHQVQGLPALRAYFDRLNAGVTSVEFAFGDEAVTGDAAAITWTMTVTLRRPRTTLVVPGASFLRFGETVRYHRDYFDAGSMLYEQLPLLGRALRWFKRLVV